MYMIANYSYYYFIHDAYNSKENNNDMNDKRSVLEQVECDVPGDLPDVRKGRPPKLHQVQLLPLPPQCTAQNANVE